MMRVLLIVFLLSAAVGVRGDHAYCEPSCGCKNGGSEKCGSIASETPWCYVDSSCPGATSGWVDYWKDCTTCDHSCCTQSCNSQTISPAWNALCCPSGGMMTHEPCGQVVCKLDDKLIGQNCPVPIPTNPPVPTPTNPPVQTPTNPPVQAPTNPPVQVPVIGSVPTSFPNVRPSTTFSSSKNSGETIAIVGGAIGAVMVLGILITCVYVHRNKKTHMIPGQIEAGPDSKGQALESIEVAKPVTATLEHRTSALEEAQEWQVARVNSGHKNLFLNFDPANDLQLDMKAAIVALVTATLTGAVVLGELPMTQFEASVNVITFSATADLQELTLVARPGLPVPGVEALFEEIEPVRVPWSDYCTWAADNAQNIEDVKNGFEIFQISIPLPDEDQCKLVPVARSMLLCAFSLSIVTLALAILPKLSKGRWVLSTVIYLLIFASIVLWGMVMGFSVSFTGAQTGTILLFCLALGGPQLVAAVLGVCSTSK